MRRRDYLRSTAAGLGLAGLPALPAAGADASPSSDAQSAADSTASATARTRETLTPLARLPVTSDSGAYQATEAVAAPDGQHVFVSKLTGFHAVDVSDPENPEVVATVEDILADDGGPMRSIYDLKYSRGRLLVASNSGRPYAGVALFDVRDPADPRLLRHHETTYGIHNCFLYGDHAYLTTGSSLEVVDVGSREPERVGGWDLTDHNANYEYVSSFAVNLHDMYVQDDRAYLAYWDAGTWILDVSEPAEPSHLGHVSDFDVEDLATGGGSLTAPPGNDHYVQPSDDGTLLAVGKESWAVTDGDDSEPEGGPSGVDLYDVADPADPTHLATIDPPPVPEGESGSYVNGYWTTAHNLDIVGDSLYSSWYRGGVKVHDVSDPAEPEEVGSWADGERAEFWTARAGVPGDFFIASSLRHPTDREEPGALYVFSDPSDNDASVTPIGPDVEIATPTPGGTATPAETPTGTPSSTPTPTETPSPTPTPTETPTSAPAPAPTETPTTVDEDGPGFGVLAALGALGAGAVRAVRGDDPDE